MTITNCTNVCPKIRNHLEEKSTCKKSFTFKFSQLYYYQMRMEPLREVIGAHLCCGLSHIDPDIQRDALKVRI